jgi:hypothetical protein
MIQPCGGHNTKTCHTEYFEFQDVITRDILIKINAILTLAGLSTVTSLRAV